ncbi:Arc family DNA-binding protein [Vibrio vulnificus]|uniref:Arc family DNA-binding protein n=1 Tax=Vibrio vulnificus TaxID=672 RepID=UPI000347D916|nr:Arc family DNA-binding protein [Vibrio vulnificus]EWS70735.1 regulatory protein [Vibrio vulnificus BAA87]NHE85659.1 Arc family DNA-binding protein [Vibrio vulnificus]POC53584.1 Arc family DNA-binding protein [Vibrio vulnificus]POC63547.1 Arc family DNA-binding protein [Vibrio vulnificus]
MSRSINPFGLRMPSDLKDKLEEEAKKNMRSLNAELVARLEKSVEGDVRLEDLSEKDAFQQILQVNAQIRVLTDVLDKLTLKAAIETGKVKVKDSK